MTNKNYVRGRSKEYRLIEKYRKLGYYFIVQRTAGSKSPFDIIAISTDEVILIQSKPKNISQKEKERIIEKNKWLNGVKTVRFRIE